MTKQELIELLKKARKQLKKYHVPKDEQTVRLSIDTLETVLSEQPTIVRCKDCKYALERCSYAVYGKPLFVCKHVRQIGRGGLEIHTDDWFCADGERRTDDA